MFAIQLQNISKNVALVFQRFPLAAIASILLTALLLNPKPYQLWRVDIIAAILTLGILFFVALRLMVESLKINQWIVLGAGLVGYGLMARYLYNTYSYGFPCLQLLLALLIWIMIVPHTNKDKSQDSIWVYNYQLWSHFLFSVLSALVLKIGIYFILFSMKYLFDITLFHDQYLKVSIFIGCFVLPMLVMAGIPAHFDDKGTNQQGAGIQRLIDFVLAPILLVLGFIIISYAIKILIVQSLPRGHVSYLVSGLGGVGSLTYILGDRSNVIHTKIYQFFRKYFFLMMIIPLVLMAIGLWSRIHQYGLTQPRYLVVLMFTWMVLFVVYSLAFKREKMSRFMMMSAAGLLSLTSFGPWGCNDLSVYSQTHRLKTLLVRNAILVNEKIQSKHPSVSIEDRKQIHASLVYIFTQGRVRDLQSWFEPDYHDLFDKTKHPAIVVSDLTQAMGFSSKGLDSLQSHEGYDQDTFNIVLNEKREGWKSLQGYDYIYQKLQLTAHNDKKSESKQSPTTISLPPYNGIDLVVRFDPSSQELSVKRKNSDQPVLKANMMAVAQNYLKDGRSSNQEKNLIFVDDDNALKILVSINTLSGKINEKGTPQITDIRCDLYVKKKAN